MVERGRELRLAQEPLAEALVLGEFGREELQGNLPLQAQVLRQVDDAHPAPPEQTLDPVAGKLRADLGVEPYAHHTSTATQTPPSPTAT